MHTLSVHIISFSIPYPANYGGLIDVFYKIKALKEAGVKIYLHCFQYDRSISDELTKYCVSVKYYKRCTGFGRCLSYRPYIVQSRYAKKLMDDLLEDDYPIIFEGLHTCYYLCDKKLKDRIKIYRESNIEHDYYFNLAKSSTKFANKIFYFIEGIKLYLFQHHLVGADYLLTVSMKDCDYLKKVFPQNNVIYLPSFNGNNTVSSKSGRGNYVLYHGNLSVEENVVAVIYLINNFAALNIPIIIAGLHPDKSIYKVAANYNNIKIIESPDDDKIHELISNAQVNLLYTFQATGLKLKLLNVLYRGRYVLVNSKMCAGTNLSELCEVADSENDMKDKLIKCFNSDFTQDMIDKRNDVLSEHYNDEINVQSLIKILSL